MYERNLLCLAVGPSVESLCVLLGVFFPFIPFHLLIWFKVQQMATGLLSGGQGGSQGLSAAFGPGSCPRPVEWLSCLMEVFQSGHLAPGDSSRHKGTGPQGEGTGTACHLRVFPVLPRLPSQLPHGLSVLPDRAVAKEQG